jgi:hypothetical protein
MKYYEVEDCHWKTEFLNSDNALYNSSMYKFDTNPKFDMRVKTLLNWEDSNRKSLCVTSYVDHFLWAGMKNLKVMKRKLNSRLMEDDPTLALDHMADLYQHVKEGLSFLDSAAKGVNDLIRMTIGRIGDQVLVRRDNWFNSFNPEVSRAVRMEMRQANLNSDGLFGHEVVSKADSQTKALKVDDVQDKFLQGASKEGATETERGRGRGRGFRGFGRGFQSRQSGLWKFKSGDKKHSFIRRGSFRGNRPGRGYGKTGRGGRGGNNGLTNNSGTA